MAYNSGRPWEADDRPWVGVKALDVKQRKGWSSMQSHFIEGAPKAIGPYCHAARVGNLIFCSGQTPLDPESMTLSGSGIREQTAQALENLSLVLKGLGLGLENVVKTMVFLKDMADFEGMNEVYVVSVRAPTVARTSTITLYPGDGYPMLKDTEAYPETSVEPAGCTWAPLRKCAITSTVAPPTP